MSKESHRGDPNDAFLNSTVEKEVEVIIALTFSDLNILKTLSLII